MAALVEAGSWKIYTPPLVKVIDSGSHVFPCQEQAEPGSKALGAEQGQAQMEMARPVWAGITLSVGQALICSHGGGRRCFYWADPSASAFRDGVFSGSPKLCA
ncbi:hypothetical protein SKAU_G00262270 [Synaphobranchus kaupii]|uniref:Uncharacterized protein n=1 Tax=Synaphobranchus kaupii TaxID=118154 RepID=A0A9Q1IMN3_SYNKA|nr:hypothetical protein SKAU_G00262270 [Synaphobranchus kaupii]